MPKLGSLQELPAAWIDKQDVTFFFERPLRQTHIRMPFGNEMQNLFRTLGDHDRDRRRVLMWRVPLDNPHYNPKKPQILKIPFLAFADEEISDTDEVLLPIWHSCMENAK